jgi:DNA-3-methyladenine glycosylase
VTAPRVAAPRVAADDLRALLGGPTLEAAEGILGAHLVRAPGAAGGEERRGRIVEVEAYVGEDDRASHARFGRTPRTEVMYGPPGRAYVYLVYGMYDCLNIVTEGPGRPAALLVRAVEPLSGVDAMRAGRIEHDLRRRRGSAAKTGGPERRASATQRVGAIPDHRLASGPGVLCAAFDITVAESGRDLLEPGGDLRLERGDAALAAARIATSARIGIGYAPEPWRGARWRFADRDSPSVSGSRASSRRSDP